MKSIFKVSLLCVGWTSCLISMNSTPPSVFDNFSELPKSPQGAPLSSSLASPSPASVAHRNSPEIASHPLPFDPNVSIYSLTQEVLNKPSGKALKLAIEQGYSQFLITKMTLNILECNQSSQVRSGFMRQVQSWQSDKLEKDIQAHAKNLKAAINCGRTRSVDRIQLQQELRAMTISGRLPLVSLLNSKKFRP